MITHTLRKLVSALKRPSVFLSYRRGDSQAITDRLYDVLVPKLGKRNVFKDVDSIGGGVEIAGRIHNSVKSSSFLLAIIGPDWEGENEQEVSRRIDTDNDWVRIEVHTALSLGVRVLPVLVNRRDRPPQRLPQDLQPLLSLNFIRVRDDPDFKQDKRRLLRAIGYRWWHERIKFLVFVIASLVFGAFGWFFTVGQIYQWDRVMVANFAQGQWDAADVIADRIIAKDPQHIRALSVKGSVAALSGEYRTAIKYFQKAYDLESENRTIRRNLAYAMLQTGRTDTAVKLYEGLRDGTGPAEYSVACAYLGAGRYDDAIRVINALPEASFSPQGGAPPGQTLILEAAALIGRGDYGDKESAIQKVRFAVAQGREYWLPILKGVNRDPHNDYQIQIRLLRPILEEAIRPLNE
jgi:tetratricopeptide (TPR) repeat protein